ncbi:MAG: SDR family oxidoreductase [candidate division WOR-3 bacterium]
MRVLITGALGHIGSRLIRDIPGFFRHPEIRMVDNMSTQRYSSLMNLPDTASYRFVEADVLEADLVPIVSGVDAVIHLAAITDAAGSFDIREKVEHVNFNATRRVAEACVGAEVPMIHLSSTSVYGTQEAEVDEECTEEELKPQSPYAETKLREERLLQELGRERGLRFITCRFGTIAGVSPGMRFHTAVNKFCWQAVFGQPVTVWRTALHQRRPYLDLSDAARAVAFILEKGLFDGRVYNVLTDNLTVNEILDFVRKDIPDLTITYVDTRIMNQLSYHVKNDRFKTAGFSFHGSIGTCIGDTIRLLKNAGGRHDR